jgi:RNA 3'-terminal phosphate cyclase
LDEHHQDQLLVYLSLANGVSKLLIGEEQSLHTQSLIYVINSFLPEV